MRGIALSSGRGPFSGVAFDVFQNEIIRADVVEVAHVGMVQGRDGASFARETFGELLFGNFDSDIPIEARVAGTINLAHAAGPNKGEDLVGAQVVAC